MTYADLVAAQLLDPFRIALLIGLVYTMWRNRAVTGTVVPLLAGLLFVAVIIPATISPPGETPMWVAVATGLAANAVIVAVLLAIWAVVRRVRP
jgi:hypothetical protein